MKKKSLWTVGLLALLGSVVFTAGAVGSVGRSGSNAPVGGYVEYHITGWTIANAVVGALLFILAFVCSVELFPSWHTGLISRIMKRVDRDP